MVSIEFGHIYLDEYIAMEHVLGKEKLLEIIKYRNLNYDNICIITLIDDYNAKRNKLNLNKFNEFLNEGLEKKVEVLYESDMILYSPITLAHLASKDSRSFKRYIQKYKKYPCSLLALTSYLIRLGIIVPKFKVTTGDRLVNILSDRFKAVEEKIMQLLARSKLKGIEKNIETIYIKGTDGLFRPST